MSKPVPIIHTRVPSALQQVFIKANRGEVVDVPPESVCRNWEEDRAQKEATKIKKSASFQDCTQWDMDQKSNEEVPKKLSLFIECCDYSDVSSHCSTDDSTAYDHLEILQRKPARLSRWDAEYSPSDSKLPPFRRQGSSRWEFKTAEKGSGIPKMPLRH